MSGCGSCSYNGFIYQFIGPKLTYQNAKDGCVQQGGILATVRDSNTWNALSDCCSSQEFHWIGLERHMCPMDQFRWIDHTACVNPRLLHIVSQPNNNACQAVAVAPSPITVGGPRAHPHSCVQTLRSICQIPQATTATATTTTQAITPQSTPLTNPNTVSANVDKTIEKIETSASPGNGSGSSLRILPREDSDYTGAIIGGLLAFLFIVIILVLLYCWRSKKWNIQRLRGLKFKSLFHANETANTNASPPDRNREDHLYYSVEAKSVGSRANSAAYSFMTDVSTQNILSTTSDVRLRDEAGPSPYHEVTESAMRPISNATLQFAEYSEVVKPGPSAAANLANGEYQEIEETKLESTDGPTDTNTDYDEISNEDLNMDYDEMRVRGQEIAYAEIAGASMGEDATKPKSLETPPKPPSRPEVSPTESQRVEYTTVRSIDQPTDVYAVVSKPLGPKQ